MFSSNKWHWLYFIYHVLNNCKSQINDLKSGSLLEITGGSMTSIETNVGPELWDLTIKGPDLLILLPGFQSVVQTSKNTAAPFLVIEENDNNNKGQRQATLEFPMLWIHSNLVN